jgi:hypothetical protein
VSRLERGVRAPVVVGLSRGNGASTLAAALHADDGGLLAPGTAGEADILLCRADERSVREAAALACAPAGPPPVLALATGPEAAGGMPPLPARRFAAVVALPHVEHWAATDVRGEARAVLAVPATDLPIPVRRYATALCRLVAALTGSALLDRTSPPLVSRPTSSPLRHGLRPVGLPGPAAQARTVPLPVPLELRPEPDDEALEAEPVPVTAGRAW